jgi:hypothetical protein
VGGSIMSLLEIKCFIIKGGCMFPITATLLFYLKFITIIIALFLIILICAVWINAKSEIPNLKFREFVKISIRLLRNRKKG